MIFAWPSWKAPPPFASGGRSSRKGTPREGISADGTPVSLRHQLQDEPNAGRIGGVLSAACRVGPDPSGYPSLCHSAVHVAFGSQGCRWSATTSSLGRRAKRPLGTKRRLHG